MPLRALIDESIRVLAGTYILAAVLIEEHVEEKTRDEIGRLSQRGLPFHWRLERPRRRAAAVDLVAALAMSQLVVVGLALRPAKQERARRQCLEELLFRLERAGVDEVCLESRNDLLDRRDRAVVDAFRARRVVTSGLRVGHARPTDEPLLWIADIVAGAVSTAEAGESLDRSRLESCIAEHRIELD